MNSRFKHAVAFMAASALFLSLNPASAADQPNNVSTTTPASHASTRAANRQLAKAVQTALYKQKGLVSEDLHVIARSGKISLVGEVPDQMQIDLAGKVAEGVTGVSSVKNNLTVEDVGR
jgi:hyperosmotically inducible protein